VDQNSWQYKAFVWTAGRPKLVKNIFNVIYLFLAILWIYYAAIYFEKAAISAGPYALGVNFGRAALLTLGLVVLPGILGRFRIELPITRIITAYRRQFGILVFALAFIHFSLVRLLLYLSGAMAFILPRPTFEVMGTFSLTILFLMFLTSNNLSKKTLKTWWKKLHRLVYVVLWILVLHTGLQKISIWTLFIFTFASVEVISWVYYFLTKSKPASGSNIP
jgi:sulfoxide reductase heme-binding subunit YedZ